MMLALLIAAALALALLPMLPALVEWRWPTDVAPLVIDPADALDPSGFARSFGERLRAAAAAGDGQLGRDVIVSITGASVGDGWPLHPREVAAAYNRRVWNIAGDARLPASQAFLAEVAASGDLRTAPGGVYRALMVGGHLDLAEGGTLLRWAHGRDVEVSAGSRLAGRVSADDSLCVGEQVRFTLLHAPTIRFSASPTDGLREAGRILRAPLPERPPGIVWDTVVGRGVCNESIAIAAGHAWDGDLVCRGRLRLGRGCHAHGSLKAHEGMRVGAASRIAGSIIAGGPVRLDRGCTVLGSVASETAVVLRPGCVVGAPGRPATVTAPRVEIAPGVVVHGTVWATAQGAALAHEGVASVSMVLPSVMSQGAAA